MSRIIFPLFCWWRLKLFIILEIFEFSLVFAVPHNCVSVPVCLRLFLRHLLSRPDGLPETLHTCFCRITGHVCHPATTKPVALCSAFKNSPERSVAKHSVQSNWISWNVRWKSQPNKRSSFSLLRPSPSSVSRQSPLISQADLLSASLQLLQLVPAFPSFSG